jgi:selenocysteine lyase/cysteine desulfurase
VTTHDLGQERCAIVTAKIGGLPAEQAAQALGRAGVNVTNTEDEIDRATELVAGLASAAM